MTIMGGSAMSFIEEEPIIALAKQRAKKWHKAVNHKYDGKDYYETHIKMVENFARDYIQLVDFRHQSSVLAAASLHDVLEDCRKTYNDVEGDFNPEVAEIVYALSNDKGRTRKERAGSAYYKGIRETKYATYVKLCDRLANVTYSKNSGSKMFGVYKKEHAGFIAALKGTTTFVGKIRYWFEKKFNLLEADYSEIYDALDELLAEDVTEIKLNYVEV